MIRASRILACLLMLSACPAPDTTPLEPPQTRATQAAYLATTEAIVTGLEASNAQEFYTLRIRYNPGRCASPNFEIHAHGTWTRALLRPTVANAKNALASIGAQRNTASYLAKVTPLARKFRASNGVDWPVFEILDVQVATQSSATPKTPFIAYNQAPCPQLPTP